MKLFYYKFFVAEDDIFETYPFSCSSIKKAMLKELSSTMYNGSSHYAEDFAKIISEVVDVIEIAEKLGNEVDWIDRMLG